MAKYFDAQAGSDDLMLLPSWQRADSELTALTEVVTADIVARFTTSSFQDPAFVSGIGRWEERQDGTTVLVGTAYAGMVKLTDGVYVALKGYAEDPAQAEARFALAMKREIAAVLRWRLPQLKRDPGVESSADGQKSMALRETAEDPFPASFPSYLRPFVIEEPSWSL